MKIKRMLAIAASTLLSPFTVGAVAVGFPAPDLSGESTKGTVRLADYQSNRHVILAFYFADFTPV